MKIKLLITFLSLSIMSCSSSKEMLNETESISSETRIGSKKDTVDEVVSNEINNKINSIIQNHLGIPISSVARSYVRKTDKGYQWKFMNVKTGEYFMANADFKFESVKIIKNKRS